MRLFISYAHVDKPIVAQWLIAPLRDAGYEVWVDEQLVAGAEWKAQLKAAIAQCDGLVYAITPESLASDVCQWEVAEARRQHKLIVPVLMQARVKLPDTLARTHGLHKTQPNELK